MLAQGHGPADIAIVIAKFPQALVEIYKFLQQNRGNGFVQATIAATPQKSSQVRVTASELRVRNSPNQFSHSNIVGGLQHGAVVTVHRRQGEWLAIEHRGAPAFIYASYTAALEVPSEHRAEPGAGGAPSETEPPPQHVAPPPAAHHEPEVAVAAPHKKPSPAVDAHPSTEPSASVATTPSSDVASTPVVPPPAAPHAEPAIAAPVAQHAAQPAAPTVVASVAPHVEPSPPAVATAARQPMPAQPAASATGKPVAQPAEPAQQTTAPVAASRTAPNVETTAVAAQEPAPAHTGTKKAETADKPAGSSDMQSMVVHVDGQYVQVYVSPLGVTHDPDVFVFFHGHDANLGIDPAMKHGQADNRSGEDTAASAMAQARTKNTIAILPQGVRGHHTADRTQEGGYMKALKDGKKGALGEFLNDIFAQVGPKLHIEGPLTPHHISLAGHSAGGYMGVHDALKSAGDLTDSITDITLMDTSYADIHFVDAQNWLFKGPGNKALRIVQAPNQIDPGYVDKEKKWHPTNRFWAKYFDQSALASVAKAHKMTVRTMTAGEDLGGNTSVYQHTQVVSSDGQVQGDVLVLISHLGHHEVRDNVMDDSIDSIGEGAEGSSKFGRNHVENLGRETTNHDAGNGAVPKDQQAQHASSPAQKATAPKKHDEVSTAAPPSPAHKPAKPVEAKTTAAHTAAPAQASAQAQAVSPANPVVDTGGEVKADHTHKGYDKDRNGLDSFGNQTERSGSRDQHIADDQHRVFANAFTTIDKATLFAGATASERRKC